LFKAASSALYSAILFVAIPIYSETVAISLVSSIRVAPIEAGPGLPFAAPSEKIFKEELCFETMLLVFF
jgi:hypothetical protein